MPILLHTHEIQPGMRLAEAFMHGQQKMLPGGKVLTQEDVQVLNRRFPSLRLRVVDPVLDKLVEFENDSHERDVAATTQRKIVEALSNVQPRITERSQVATVNLSAMQNAVAQVMEYLEQNPVSAAIISRGLGTETYLAEHTGNVFYLSMVLGSAVRDYVVKERQRQTATHELSTVQAMSLMPLGLGVMCMDLGMLPLKDLLRRDNPLTAQEHQLLREHPIAGAEMIPDSANPTARMIVRTHHENYDGSGYPQGLKGDKLHVFTRIVRIADSFDAGTASQVYKQAKTPARMMWDMCKGPQRRFYDPVLTKVFASLIQPFPIGAKLRLSDHRVAVVVRYNRTDPFAPTVIVAFDEHDRPIPLEQLQKPITLDEASGLRIASFGSEDMSYIYQSEPPLADSPDRSVFASIYEAAVP